MPTLVGLLILYHDPSELRGVAQNAASWGV